VGIAIHRIIAEAIQKEITEPDAWKITITRVSITPNLRMAKVYFAFIGEEAEQKNLENILAENKTRTIWIAEPITLYLNGKVSYYPLINHTNFYKPSNDTATIKALGFWNQTLLDQWLKEADLLVLDPNRLALAKIELKPELEANWEKITPPATVWPPGLEFYLPKSQATIFPDASPSE